MGNKEKWLEAHQLWVQLRDKIDSSQNWNGSRATNKDWFDLVSQLEDIDLPEMMTKAAQMGDLVRNARPAAVFKKTYVRWESITGAIDRGLMGSDGSLVNADKLALTLKQEAEGQNPNDAPADAQKWEQCLEQIKQ